MSGKGKKYQTTRKTAFIAYDSLLENLVIPNRDENFFEYFSLQDVQAALNKVYNLKDRNLMQYYTCRPGDTAESIELIQQSRLIYGAYEDEYGRIGIEGVISFPGNVKIPKKTMANLKDFIDKNGVSQLKVGIYYLRMGKRKSEPKWAFW